MTKLSTMQIVCDVLTQTVAIKRSKTNQTALLNRFSQKNDIYSEQSLGWLMGADACLLWCANPSNVGRPLSATMMISYTEVYDYSWGLR